MPLDEKTKSHIADEINRKIREKEEKIFNVLSFRNFWVKIIGTIGLLTLAFSGLFWLYVDVISTISLSIYQAAVLAIITLSGSGMIALALVLLARAGKDDH